MNPFHSAGFNVIQPHYKTVNSDRLASISCEHTANVTSVEDIRLYGIPLYVSWCYSIDSIQVMAMSYGFCVHKTALEPQGKSACSNAPKQCRIMTEFLFLDELILKNE